MPFNDRDTTRVAADDISFNYKVRYKKIPFADVKKEVQAIRDKREKDKMD